MRILYGVMGEGLGHAMRARVVAAGLVERGHQVLIASSGRAAKLLAGELGGSAQPPYTAGGSDPFDVLEIEGLHLSYANGGVRRAATLVENVRQTPARMKKNARGPLGKALAFDPELVITDFESFAHTVGRLLGVPIVSLDHQHVITTCRHHAVRKFLPRDFLVTHAFVAAKTPRCSRYVVSSFFFPPLKARHVDDTVLVGPIVRPEIRARRSATTTRDHVLVYQTAAGDPALLPALSGMVDVPFVVYGARGEAKHRNVTLRSFDAERFADDLASARAVIANGGYTTLAEAAFLEKPVLSVPLRHQGEQEINAAYLEALGLGRRADRISAVNIRRFLDEIGPRPPRDPRLDSGAFDALAAVEVALRRAA